MVILVSVKHFFKKMRDKMIVELRFLRLKIVAKYFFYFAGHDELCSELKFSQTLVNQIANFWKIIFSVKSNGRFANRGNLLKIRV